MCLKFSAFLHVDIEYFKYLPVSEIPYLQLNFMQKPFCSLLKLLNIV